MWQLWPRPPGNIPGGRSILRQYLLVDCSLSLRQKKQKSSVWKKGEEKRQCLTDQQDSLTDLDFENIQAPRDNVLIDNCLPIDVREEREALARKRELLAQRGLRTQGSDVSGASDHKSKLHAARSDLSAASEFLGQRNVRHLGSDVSAASERLPPTVEFGGSDVSASSDGLQRAFFPMRSDVSAASERNQPTLLRAGSDVSAASGRGQRALRSARSDVSAASERKQRTLRSARSDISAASERKRRSDVSATSYK